MAEQQAASDPLPEKEENPSNDSVSSDASSAEEESDSDIVLDDTGIPSAETLNVNTVQAKAPKSSKKGKSTQKPTATVPTETKQEGVQIEPSTGNKLVKRVRFSNQHDGKDVTKSKPPPKRLKQLPPPQAQTPATSSVSLKDGIMIALVMLCLFLVLNKGTSPSTVIMMPPDGNNRPESGLQNIRHRDVVYDPKMEPTKKPAMERMWNDNMLLHPSRGENENYQNLPRRHLDSVYEENASGNKKYFMTNRDLVKRTQGITFITNASAFIRGYARMKLVCDEIIDVMGLRSVIEQTDNVKTSVSRFDMGIYLPSGSIFSPNFCINTPGDGLFVYALDHNSGLSPNELTSHQQHTTLWHDMMASAKVITESISQSQSFASSILHTPALMGYFASNFYARDLQALGNKTNTSLITNVVPYTVFSVATDRITTEHSKPACICGAHMNMARHIVIYAGEQAPKGRLYIEPTIISKSETATIHAATAPWVRTSLDTTEMTAYQNAEESLRNELKLRSYPSSHTITVDSMQLSHATIGYKKVIQHDGGRQVSQLSGSEASCICYCEALTYEIRRAAERLRQEKPQDVTLTITDTVPLKTAP